MIARCFCCGTVAAPWQLVLVDGGPMHFRCWERHHSDPTGEWPLGHECEGDRP